MNTLWVPVPVTSSYTLEHTHLEYNILPQHIMLYELHWTPLTMQWYQPLEEIACHTEGSNALQHFEGASWICAGWLWYYTWTLRHRRRTQRGYWSEILSLWCSPEPWSWLPSVLPQDPAAFLLDLFPCLRVFWNNKPTFSQLQKGLRKCSQ